MNKKKSKIKNQKSKIRNKSTFDFKIFLLVFTLSFFIAFFTIYVFIFKKPLVIGGKKVKQKTVLKEKSAEYSFSKAKEFLKFKASFYYDPLNLIDDLKKQTNEILLVDCRDKESFEKEHIKKANLFESIEQVLKLTKDKKVVVLYGNYNDEPKVNEIALDLLSRGLKVKILSVGYNQFRHLKIFFLPQSQWDKVNPEEWIEF